ncbi:hypothetical protein QEG73_05160 [Chitinophagaceae bacterium 26-R-25]|nr:hypothetical protein [Chitinophagaceae bacterium 26-R-25]
MSGSLQKLVIHSFKDKDFKDEDTESMFTAPINPESFTKNYKIELDARGAHGSSGRDPRFKATGPEQLKLDFILDGTGTMEGYFGAKDKKDKDGKDLSIDKALKLFLKCVYDYNPTTHRPRFLIIFWGSEIKFPCVVQSLDINHTLFDPKGFPIRVKITATFMGFETPESQVALSRLSSPDLTHYKKVTAGDRLDLMTYKIYTDSKYFLQVAKANNLVGLRNVKPNTNLFFPPFDKNEKNV